MNINIIKIWHVTSYIEILIVNNIIIAINIVFAIIKHIILQSIICSHWLQVTNRLQRLYDDFEDMQDKKKKLEQNIAMCEKKLDRAEKLIGGLGGEKDRWTNNAIELSSAYINITGDVLLSGAVVAYMGAFTVDFRQVSLKCQSSFGAVKLQLVSTSTTHLLPYNSHSVCS